MKRNIAIVVALCLAPSLFAFDGNRKGFVLGFGLGPGYLGYRQSIEDGYTEITSDPEQGFGLATSFRIGYAPSEGLEICYVSKVTWIRFENAFGEEIIMTNGIAGLGLAWYFTPGEAGRWQPSPFLTGGLGLASWSAPFEDMDPWLGFGGFVGLGYEFAKHFAIETSILYSSPSDSAYGITARTNALSVQLTLNATAY